MKIGNYFGNGILLTLLAFSAINFSIINLQTVSGQVASRDIKYSENRPLLNGVLNDTAWEDATKEKYELTNLAGYSSHFANLEVWFLGTPFGLYVAMKLSLVYVDNVNGLSLPVLIMVFDNNDDQILDINDDLFYHAPNLNGSFQGTGPALGSVWKASEIHFAGNFSSVLDTIKTDHLVLEFYYPDLKSTSQLRTVGVDFGIHYFDPFFFEQYMYMIDSGNRAFSGFTSTGDYNAELFAKMHLHPGLNIDFYPPQINFLTPINSKDGIYQLEVLVIDLNLVKNVSFSDDGGNQWTEIYELQLGSGIYVHQWNSSGYNGSAIYFLAADEAGNQATHTVLTDTSSPDQSIVFYPIIIDNSAPLIDLISPVPNSIVLGIVDVIVSVYDLTQVKKVEWSIGSGAWTAMSLDLQSGYWVAQWNTNQYPDGSYTLNFAATDILGNEISLVSFTNIRVEASYNGTITEVSTVSGSAVTFTETIHNTVTEIETKFEPTTETQTVEGSNTQASPISLLTMLTTFLLSVIIIRKKLMAKKVR